VDLSGTEIHLSVADELEMKGYVVKILVTKKAE
jgi:hypothetical protein